MFFSWMRAPAVRQTPLARQNVLVRKKLFAPRLFSGAVQPKAVGPTAGGVGIFGDLRWGNRANFKV
jgi:hypothetical protein